MQKPKFGDVHAWLSMHVFINNILNCYSFSYGYMSIAGVSKLVYLLKNITGQCPKSKVITTHFLIKFPVTLHSILLYSYILF